MRKFSITDKLVIASISLSIGTILIVASFSFYNAKKAILDRTFNQLTSVRVIKSNLIKNYFSNCFAEIKLAKTSSDIISMISEINKKTPSKNNQSSKLLGITVNNSFLNELRKEKYDAIYLIGKNKMIYTIKESKNKSPINFTEIWNKTLSNTEIFVKDFRKISKVKHSNIILSSKVINNQNKVIGIVIFELTPTVIDAIMLENNASNGFGYSGESYLVGNDYLMRSSSRFHSNSVLNTIVKTEAVNNALQNNTAFKIIKDYRGEVVLSSFSKLNIPNLNWVILAEIDYKEATVPIFNIRSEIIFISIFIFLIVLIVVIILSNKITYPIQKLNIAAQKIGEGNFDIDLNSNLNDEIGELTDSFTKMAEKLKIQTEELKEEKRKRLSSLIDGQEKERQRLSRELHDSLGQLLIGLKLKFENLLNQNNIIKNDNEAEELGNLFNLTIDETRRISNNLMPAALSEFGLTAAIRNLCNTFSETSNIVIQFNTFGNAENVNQKLQIYIFRIIQEGITNIVKHANANKVIVNLTFETHKIKLEIIDNGKGFDITNSVHLNSHGISNIKDRVTLFKGKLKFKSEKNKGTTIIIEFPLKK
ncbi:HAMP domain-containing protein [Lutibacter sp.]|uniref:sensor histidine kinase n=1 Tax=Lutibacter sp. TaxID=1925666 RepID=UPI0025BCC9A0|nr:HAMP domain-containing protein [Lutibacter sp.]MCF6181858.1 histidine kinase [Lutibacter sp.]